ncbi:putative ribosomal protein L34Ae [Lupinus albus]|uniref:Putative ribosomal protein L34Ae n=1 Tax=Lupinus albus TaxID=3870 RepID=A0A6A4QPP8_LUPAL|nr:putative ribosomal protein L34Ae [Lupinus albus]
MDTKSLVNDFVYVNMLWAFGSLRIFICNYMLYSLGLILRYFFRFLKVADAEKELLKPQSEADGCERNIEIDGFREELANFLFLRGDDDGLEGSGEREEDSESSDFMDSVSDVPEDSEKLEGEKECFVFKEIHSDIHEGIEKTEVYTECSVSKENIHQDGDEKTVDGGSVFMEIDSSSAVFHEDGEKSREENEGFVFVETNCDVHQDGKIIIDEDETKSSVFKEKGSSDQPDSITIEQEETDESFSTESEYNVHEDSKNIEEGETENSVFMHSCSDVNEGNKKIEENEEGTVFVETETATTTSMYQYMSGKDIISGFIEEPTAMRFSFREFFMGPGVSPVSNNACARTNIIPNNVFSELHTEKLVQFESEAFGETDSSDDEDNFPSNENSVESDSESESSTSSGLIWGNGNKFEDSFEYQFLASNEGFESELFKQIMREEKIEYVEEKHFSCGGKVSAEDGYIEMEGSVKDLKSSDAYSFGYEDQNDGSRHEEKACRNEKSEETRWEKELCESEFDTENEDNFEWEHDDLVEQLKIELKNARQGGLATIFEEEDEEVEEEALEVEHPKVVEDLKSLKIGDKLEYKDQIDEIGNVYKSYAEEMKKLDILNYQTMHALGLLQLKDPLKLVSIPKSTIPSAKPVITQNLWRRKASKNTSDPLLKIVNELHRDLELVYVGQVCLSWEILCWQHKKAQELQEFHSQGCRYNHVASEFQLFQVLLNRFIENEPFQQGTRIQNYVMNRCVIRNLLQVPAIKDDSMKDRNIAKGDEKDDAISRARLVDIIKESMSVFWEFVRADKDYGNVILKASQQIGLELKDPATSCLLVDIRTQLQKACFLK